MKNILDHDCDEVISFLSDRSGSSREDILVALSRFGKEIVVGKMNGRRKDHS